MALRSVNPSFNLSSAAVRAIQWLRAAQLPDGSWPATGEYQGCWTTALACLALRPYSGSLHSTLRGVNWLIDIWPAEGSLGWRLRNALRRNKSIVHQNSSL